MKPVLVRAFDPGSDYHYWCAGCSKPENAAVILESGRLLSWPVTLGFCADCWNLILTDSLMLDLPAKGDS